MRSIETRLLSLERLEARVGALERGMRALSDRLDTIDGKLDAHIRTVHRYATGSGGRHVRLRPHAPLKPVLQRVACLLSLERTRAYPCIAE